MAAVDSAVIAALAKVDGIIDASNAETPAKIGWNRASRTDAGVHALGNVISCKVIRADWPLRSSCLTTAPLAPRIAAPCRPCLVHALRSLPAPGGGCQ